MANKAVLDLTLEELDYFVAEAEGIMYMRDERGNVLELGDDGQVYGKTADLRMYSYQPTRDWRHGGPIVEKLNMSLQRSGSNWVAQIGDEPSTPGPSPLVAAMRAFVRFKFGETIDVDSTDH